MFCDASELGLFRKLAGVAGPSWSASETPKSEQLQVDAQRPDIETNASSVISARVRGLML